MPGFKLADFKNTVLFGGLGTGCLKWNSDCSNSFVGLVKTSLSEYADKTPANENPIILAAGVKRAGEDFASAILGVPEKESNIPVIEPENFVKQISFASMNFSDKVLKDIDIKLNVFNPTIVHNPIDSGIPAAFFEFTVTNNAKEPALVSICMAARSFFSQGKSSFGYDNISGASYAMLSEVSKSVYARRKGSICIATDFPDFTYDAAPEISAKELLGLFDKNSGFLSDNTDVKEIGIQRNISTLVSCHAKIMPGASRKIRMVAAWCFPYCGDGVMKKADKNYYFHYFPDAVNCISYCFTHFDRLMKENAFTTELFSSSGMPENTKNTILHCADAIKNPLIRRDIKGVLHGIGEINTEKSSCASSFALEYMFPGITLATNSATIAKLIKAGGKRTETGDFEPSAYDTNCTPNQIYARLMLLIRLYRGYKTSSDLKFYSENWVDITYMANMLCRMAMHLAKASGTKSDGSKYVKMFSAVICVLKIMTDISEKLSDKKRRIHFLDMYTKAADAFEEFLGKNRSDISSQILSTRFISEYLCDIRLYDEDTVINSAKTVLSNSPDNDFYTYACLVACGYMGSAGEILENLLDREYPELNRKVYDAALESMVMINAHSGFDYDKNLMSVEFSPDERFCDSDRVYKSFISFDGAYGYVEQGQDYIELVLLSGEIKVKRFSCSHKPYKAMYGGRIWNCDVEGNTVIMDSNLIVNKNKRLTLLIDITK